MPRNLYLAGIAAIALGAAILLPRLVEGDGRSFFADLLTGSGPERVDRLQVGSPPAQDID